MTVDLNPDVAHERFWTEHAGAFGVEGVEIAPQPAVELSHGVARVYASAQRIEGLPVEYSSARVLVEVGQFSRVKFAAARFAPLPFQPFAPLEVNAEEAVALVRDTKEYGYLSDWTKPELVVFAGEPEQWATGPGAFGEPVRTWKFRGEQFPPAGFAAFTFFVDAASGAVVHIRDEVVTTNVIGTVVAKATPGTLPDTTGNPPVDAPLPDLRVFVVGGNSNFSDANGSFDIPHGGTADVTVAANVSDGRWVNVNNGITGQPDLSASATLTPGTSGTLRLNATPTEVGTAQANLFVHVNKVRKFFQDFVPTWNGLDYPLQAWANSEVISDDARFTGSSIIFSEGSPGYAPNFAYSFFIAHETGHWVVHQLALAQWSFGEGFGDALATLLYDDPFYGRGMPTSYQRDYSPGQPEKTYPCSGEPHECGKVLAGLWWDIYSRAATEIWRMARRIAPPSAPRQSRTASPATHSHTAIRARRPRLAPMEWRHSIVRRPGRALRTARRASIRSESRSAT
ncbi:MAG: hypothetical protein HZB38_05615 [Planctomycetes bacterium]|nr:hypothetical protein [Planctomycetota bacterium]